jgi:hypothetical protein
MVYPKVAVYPYIRLVDGCPSIASQLNSGEIERSSIISIVLKTAVYASEERLALLMYPHLKQAIEMFFDLTWTYVDFSFQSLRQLLEILYFFLIP